MFPVMLAVNTWPRARKLTASTTPVTAVMIKSRVGATLALEGTSFLMAAAYSLLAAQLLQTMLLGGGLLLRNYAVVVRVFRAWRASLFAGFMGAAASAGWFTAMAINPVASVRTLGLVELLFCYVVSRRIFQEQLSRRELTALGVLALALVIVTLQR